MKTERKLVTTPSKTLDRSIVIVCELSRVGCQRCLSSLC
jgi:hypothetical protein